MNKPFAELRSGRLVLRRLRPDDAPAIGAYRGLPAVARFQSWEAFTPDDAARLIAGQAGLTPDTPGTWFQLGIAIEDSGTLIGDCGIHFRGDDPRQVELGITLDPLTRPARAGGTRPKRWGACWVTSSAHSANTG